MARRSIYNLGFAQKFEHPVRLSLSRVSSKTFGIPIKETASDFAEKEKYGTLLNYTYAIESQNQVHLMNIS